MDLVLLLCTIMVACIVAGVFLSSGVLSTGKATTTTTLFLRVGGQLTTDAPSMDVVTAKEKKAVTDLHANSPFFHSDHAHTDYVSNRPDGGASWTSPPLSSSYVLQKSRIQTSLWIGTNAKATDFTASLSRWTEKDGWSSLCGATVSTLSRKLSLPGKAMIDVMANGGYCVELPVEMELKQAVIVNAGDVLRLDVSGNDKATAEAGGDAIVHRIWHAPRWASSVQLHVESKGSPVELKFKPGPDVAQPTP